jgi:hypothetical protein
MLLRAAQMTPQTPPDNSKANSNHQKTADNQSNESNDRVTTAKVNTSLVAMRPTV